MKKTPIIKNDEIFVINIKEKFPVGTIQPTRELIQSYRPKTDIKKPRQKRTSRRKQISKAKQKRALGYRLIEGHDDIEYYDICDDLRDLGYSELFESTDWKKTLKEEKEFIRRGYKTKISYFDGWYSLWGRK